MKAWMILIFGCAICIFLDLYVGYCASWGHAKVGEDYREQAEAHCALYERSDMEMGLASRASMLLPSYTVREDLRGDPTDPYPTTVSSTPFIAVHLIGWILLFAGLGYINRKRR